MKYKICEYPNAQCEFRCGSTNTPMLVRKDISREIEGIFVDDEDRYSCGVYHWEEKNVGLCSNQGLCSVWKKNTSENIMKTCFTNSVYIFSDIEDIVFTEDIHSEKTLFKLHEWFRYLYKKTKCEEYLSKMDIEQFKVRLKDKYSLWIERKRQLGLPV